MWLTGLPSAGKSTIAHGCEAELRTRGLRVEVLDGDAVRPHLAAARGFSREDRAVNIRRIGWVAELLARNGVLVLVSAIAPYRDVRDEVRAAHAAGDTPFVEVYVSTPVRVTSDRDVKGLYARQRAGELTGLTGVDDPYEEPLDPEPAGPVIVALRPDGDRRFGTSNRGSSSRRSRAADHGVRPAACHSVRWALRRAGHPAPRRPARFGPGAVPGSPRPGRAGRARSGLGRRQRAARGRCRSRGPWSAA